MDGCPGVSVPVPHPTDTQHLHSVFNIAKHTSVFGRWTSSDTLRKNRVSNNPPTPTVPPPSSRKVHPLMHCSATADYDTVHFTSLALLIFCFSNNLTFGSDAAQTHTRSREEKNSPTSCRNSLGDAIKSD